MKLIMPKVELILFVNMKLQMIQKFLNRFINMKNIKKNCKFENV